MVRFNRKEVIRPALPSDAEWVKKVAAATPNRKFDGMGFWAAKTAQRPHLSLVAEGKGQVVGWIVGWPDESDETKLRFDVFVEASLVEGGLYRGLMKGLEHAARGAAQLRISLFDNESQLLIALQNEGFLEDHRTIHSRLTLVEANISRAEMALASCTEQGFVLSETSLHGADQPDFWPRLSAVHNSLTIAAYDDPRPQFPTESVQAFIGGGQFPGLNGRMFVAHSGQDVVGYATVFHEGVGLHHGFTGVAPTYQRNGIALALKALIFRYALRHGLDYLDTGNRADNLPVISLNRSLGYKPEMVELHMWKHLTP